MILRCAVALVVSSVVALGEMKPATRNSSRPATTRATTQHFPTPQELLEQIKQSKAARKKLKQVAYIDLSDPIQERPAEFSFFRNTEGHTLRSVLDRLAQARDDGHVRAVLITFGEPGLNLAQAAEIRDALRACRDKGKRTFVYADSYDTATYTVASAASDVCMLEGGEILIPGVGIETMFAKGLLDKVGVRADYIQIGEYKGADEMFTRTEASEQMKGELNRLSQSIYDYVVASVARERKLEPSAVKGAIDQALITGAEAKKLGLVDHLVDVDGLRGLMKRKLKGEIDLLHKYGEERDEEVDFSNPWALFAQMAKQPEVSAGPKVAVIYAEGQIVDGEGGESMFGGGVVGSEDMREAFRMAARNDEVKAVVVRIDSPGGSALASEAMWQAARRLAKEKPLVISIGSMAASGGYYLASAGDHIVADPTAIVGSIGVVGGKFVLSDLYAKLGLRTESFSRGANADLFSNSAAFTDRQRELVTGWMRQTYEQFTRRILATRSKKIKDIDQVARGRIFMAQEARELGMVDELGGLSRALAVAATKGGLEEGEYEVMTLPPARTLADYFRGGRQAASPVRAGVMSGLVVTPDSLLHALPLSARTAVVRHVRALQLLEKRPVMLMAPYTVTIR